MLDMHNGATVLRADIWADDGDVVSGTVLARSQRDYVVWTCYRNPRDHVWQTTNGHYVPVAPNATLDATANAYRHAVAIYNQRRGVSSV